MISDTESNLMDFYRLPKWIFGFLVIDGADTHRPVLPANALHKLIPSLLREFLSQAVKEQTNWDAAHPRHCLSRKYPPLLCLRLPLSSFGPYVTPD